MTMSERKFYRKVYRVTVLSDEPIRCESLADIDYAITDGGSVGQVEEQSDGQLTAKSAALLCLEMDSDPGFFSLTEEGEDLDAPPLAEDCASDNPAAYTP